MKHLVQKHKGKIIFATPIFLLVILIFGALYVLSFEAREPLENKVDEYKIIREQFKDLDIRAKAFVVYDSSHKKIIYARNRLAQLPLASLTKIMSTLIALEIAGGDTIIEIRAENKISNVNDRYSLIPGSWKLRDLLKLTLVSSSNSGIGIISDRLSLLQEFPTGEDYFVLLMNKKAKALGLNQTYFLNESGLDLSDSLAGAYGSATDMVTLFDYAIRYDPDIFGATKYDSIVINSVEGNSEAVPNTNKSVSEISGLVASKTGLTELAGGNLVIAFDTKDGSRIIVVILGSTQDDRFLDAENLANIFKR